MRKSQAVYDLTRDELRYILDPKEVHVEHFPSKTFRVLKEKEVKQFGEYGKSNAVGIVNTED